MPHNFFEEMKRLGTRSSDLILKIADLDGRARRTAANLHEG
jgi:hypothetical protein